MNVNLGQEETLPKKSPSLSARLEGGELVYFPTCPFPLVSGEDRQFLLRRKLGGKLHKNISYDPASGRTSGCRRCAPEKEARLRRILADFSHQATAWLGAVLPRYAQSWRLDRVHYRP